MSRGSEWVPLDKYLTQEFKSIKREFSMIEAMFSYTVDIDNGHESSISGYSKLWGWSRNKVRRFLKGIRTDKGHSRDNRRTGKGHAIHFIDKGLWSKKDSKRTAKGQSKDRQEDTTTNPNPNPNKKIPPSQGIFRGKNQDVKSSNSSENFSKTFLKINQNCQIIISLPNTSRRKAKFNPMEWAQKQITDKKHPGAISKTLDGLATYWDRSRDPWVYADEILKKVNGTFNEAENIAMHKELKALSPDMDLAQLFTGAKL